MVGIIILLIVAFSVMGVVLYGICTYKTPEEYRWFEVPPDPNCELCGGSGKIGFTDNDSIICPCSEELV